MIAKRFNMFRLYLPITFFILATWIGFILLKKAVQYQAVEGRIDLNYESYIISSIIMIVLAFLYLILIIQYTATDYKTNLYLYPDTNSFKISNWLHKDLRVHVSDIQSVVIKKIGIEPYYLDGYTIIYLKDNKQVLLTSGVISMYEWDQFLKTGSKKKIVNKIMPLLPLKSNKKRILTTE